MAKEKNLCCETKKWGKANSNASTGAIYCLGFIGAVIYYIQQATSFWSGVIGFLKALIWPATLVYKLFEFLKM